MENSQWITKTSNVKYKSNEKKQLHSLEGPAVIIDTFCEDQRIIIKEYYINGIKYTEEEYEGVKKFILKK